MKSVKTFLPVFSLLFLLSSCARIEEPEFRRLEKFNVRNMGLQKADVGFSVTYYNPNNFSLAVKEAAIDVYVDSVYIGKFQQDQLVSVDKKAEFSIPLSGAVPLMKAVELNVQDLMNREVAVRASGSVKVGKGGVFVTRNFAYQGKHKVDIGL